MLGKLMKYEWKNIWRAGTLMLLGMLAVTVIGCVVLRMPGGLVTEIVDGNDINAAQSWFVVSSFVKFLRKHWNRHAPYSLRVTMKKPSLSSKSMLNHNRRTGIITIGMAYVA